MDPTKEQSGVSSDPNAQASDTAMSSSEQVASQQSNSGVPVVDVVVPESAPPVIQETPVPDTATATSLDPAAADTAPFVPNSHADEKPLSSGTVLSGEPQPTSVDDAASVSAEQTNPEPNTAVETPSGTLPTASEEPAEPPTDDFSPKFEEAKGGALDNVPVAAPEAFAAAVAAEASKPTDTPKSPVSANSVDLAQKTGKHGHAHSKKLLVLAVLLLGLLLSALLVYVYVSSNNSVEQEKSQSSSQNQTDQTSNNSTANEQVDSAIEDSAQDLNSINEADFSDSDLSDQNLGL